MMHGTPATRSSPNLAKAAADRVNAGRAGAKGSAVAQPSARPNVPPRSRAVTSQVAVARRTTSAVAVAIASQLATQQQQQQQQQQHKRAQFPPPKIPQRSPTADPKGKPKQQSSTRRNTLTIPQKHSLTSDGMLRSNEQRKNEVYTVVYELPGSTPAEPKFISLTVPATADALTAKALMVQRVAQTLHRRSGGSERGRGSGTAPLDPDRFVLRVGPLPDYLFNQTLSLRRAPLLQICTKNFCMPALMLVERTPEIVARQTPEAEAESKEIRIAELQLQQEISEISGSTLRKFLTLERPEIDKCRRVLARDRFELVSKIIETESLDLIDCLAQYRNNVAKPLKIPSILRVLCTLPNSTPSSSERMVKRLACKPESTASELRESCFKKFKMLDPRSTANKSAQDYVLKSTGFNDYLIGDHPVIVFDFVRERVGQELEIEVSLIPCNQIPELVNPWPSFDPVSVTDAILTAPSFSTDNNFESLLAKNALIEEPADIAAVNPDSDEDPPLASIFALNRLFKVQVFGADDMTGVGDGDAFLYVHCEVYHGGKRICAPAFTNPVAVRDSPRWNEWISFGRLLYCDLPQHARLCFTVYLRPSKNQQEIREHAVLPNDTPVGNGNFQLVDHQGALKMGLQAMKLWPEGPHNPIGTCVDNFDDPKPPRLFFEIETFRCPIVFPLPRFDLADTTTRQVTKPGPQIVELLNAILEKNALTPVDEAENNMLYLYRTELTDRPEALSKVLLSIDWANPAQVNEAHRLVKLWKRPSPIQALEMLDAKFADLVIRDYAVECLGSLSDGKLSAFMLQLSQVLKYEPYHSSGLARFLIKKAIVSPNVIGIKLFWLLKSEVHDPVIAERFGLLLEALLRGSGPQFRDELKRQVSVVSQLVDIAVQIKNEKFSKSERDACLANGLKNLKLPDYFALPFDPRISVRGLILEKCRYMGSKKKPLWLVFENADPHGKPVTVMFKEGDDLRQDALTLQMLRIMDDLWKTDGLDLHMSPYRCCATGDEVGFVEIVLNADTMANINKARGGAAAVLQKDTLSRWLRQNCATEKDYEQAQRNFLLSAAGYCVATYVLGIGDRHNDNIMLKRDGHLFHIDFGHFLGNFKKKFGFKRERAPFIFTAQYLDILGGKRNPLYAEFLEMCGKAYNVLRKHANLFINLFMMMLSTGIPELTSEEDIQWLAQAFETELSDEQAASKFASLVEQALNTKTTTINDMVHVWVHS